MRTTIITTTDDDMKHMGRHSARKIHMRKGLHFVWLFFASWPASLTVPFPCFGRFRTAASQWCVGRENVHKNKIKCCAERVSFVRSEVNANKWQMRLLRWEVGKGIPCSGNLDAVYGDGHTMDKAAWWEGTARFVLLFIRSAWGG